MGKQYRYHSQNGEDYLLSKYFDFRPTGFYVDVGAFDGVYLSNSYSFEQQGWQGICVEPTPRYFEICQRNRPNAIGVHAACISDETVKTVEFQFEELGVVSGIHATHDDVGLRNTYQSFGAEFKGFQKIDVPAQTLNRILRTHLPIGGEIDFISLDVEGSELDVLRGLDLKKYHPRVLVIEANTDEDVTMLSDYLNDIGYVFARKVKWNAFFVRRDEDVKKLQSIVIRCRLEPQEHPLNNQFNLPARDVHSGEGKKQYFKRLLKQLIGVSRKR